LAIIELFCLICCYLSYFSRDFHLVAERSRRERCVLPRAHTRVYVYVTPSGLAAPRQQPTPRKGNIQWKNNNTPLGSERQQGQDNRKPNGAEQDADGYAEQKERWAITHLFLVHFDLLEPNVSLGITRRILGLHEVVVQIVDILSFWVYCFVVAEVSSVNVDDDKVSAFAEIGG